MNRVLLKIVQAVNTSWCWEKCLLSIKTNATISVCLPTASRLQSLPAAFSVKKLLQAPFSLTWVPAYILSLESLLLTQQQTVKSQLSLNKTSPSHFLLIQSKSWQDLQRSIRHSGLESQPPWPLPFLLHCNYRSSAWTIPLLKTSGFPLQVSDPMSPSQWGPPWFTQCKIVAPLPPLLKCFSTTLVTIQHTAYRFILISASLSQYSFPLREQEFWSTLFTAFVPAPHIE